MGVEDSTSPEIARRVDARCDEFERALATGGSPAIEDYLANAASDERCPLLEELLWLEVDFRIARGEHPQVADYSDRFPEISPNRLAIIVSGFMAEDAWIGRKLHVYQCVSLIGSGAMGRVYLALHHDLQRHCAIKILSPRRGVCDADYVARFHCEGQAAAALIHPNIVTLHAVGQIDETHFLEMEYVAGRSLQRLIQDEGPLPADQALQLAAMVAEGLAAAHRAGIVHRDVKPDNIMVTRAGIAKVGDFGLARMMSVEGTHLTNAICGTPNYMAPELLRGEIATPASDVYALGLCLFQMLIGRLPWVGKNLTELMLSGRTEQVPNVRDLRPDLSNELAGCVARMTSPIPDERPVDAGAAAALLRAVLGQERDLESLFIEAFANETTVTWVRSGNQYRITRRLPGDRRQTVIVETTDHDLSDRLLILYSICCPAVPEYFEQALRQNSVIMHASLAIRDVEGQSMFVVINAYPRSTVGAEEIRRSVLEIAVHADQVEALLTHSDLH